MSDSLIEEARNAGQAYLTSFKGDREAMLADLRERQQRDGRRVVSLPSKPPRQRSPERR